MSSYDKKPGKSSELDDLIDNLISDEDLERYFAEQKDGLTHEEREKIKRENRINAINQWCAENPGSGVFQVSCRLKLNFMPPAFLLFSQDSNLLRLSLTNLVTFLTNDLGYSI